jgi:hypothetical protein
VSNEETTKNEGDCNFPFLFKHWNMLTCQMILQSE